MTNQRGFTLAELLIASGFFMTLSGMGVAVLGSAVPSVRTDGQMNRLVTVLQVARETAITRQRDVEVRIDEEASSITLVRHDEDGEVPIRSIVFEYGVKLHKFDGMGDTPEEYGDAGAADFGGAASLIFAPDGSFVANDNMPLNGTFFLGMDGKPDTARAVTLTGATARPRKYIWRTVAGDGDWVAR